MTNETTLAETTPSILHVSVREALRPIRDEILRVSGYVVTSTSDRDEAITMLREKSFSLVLVDVAVKEGIPLAEFLCSTVKKIDPDQLVAFVCNWRVALMTDCPDHILRAEFDPEAFVAGVKDMLTPVTAEQTPGRQ